MRRLVVTTFSTLFLLFAQPASANSTVGDLDLLSRANVLPNVIFLIDNSGSMKNTLDGSTRIEVAGDAVKTLIENLYPDDGSGGYTPRARLGIAVFDKSGRQNGGVIEIEISDSNKTAILAEVDDIIAWRLDPSTPLTATPLSESLVDVGRYFAGQHGFGSYPSVATTSPIDLECRENFVVLVTDGEPNDDENDHYGAAVAGTTAYSAFVNTVGNADNDSNECTADLPDMCIDDPHDGRDDGFDYANNDGTDWLDDVAYHLANTDLVPDAALSGTQSVKTFTIGFTTDIPLLDETAVNGQGEYFTATNATTLSTSLQNSFDSIFDQTNASFTSAVVPGATIGLGNAFFNSYFVSSNEPVWEGHLEMLRIAPTGTIQDRNLAPAVDPATGELETTRVAYWDAADELKTNTSRTIYTTVAGAPALLDTTNVTAANLAVTASDLPTFPNHPTSGIDTVAEIPAALIDYVHGKDAFDEDNDSDASEMRDIVLGDIFHSTPRAIAKPTRFLAHEPSYGGPLGFLSLYNTRDRVVYAGANDGMLHAFAAGQHQIGDDPDTPEIEAEYYSTSGAQADGSERFGYVPGFLQSRLKEIPRNSPRTEFFVDGPIAVADAWVGDGSGSDITKAASEWATVLISGMREGGDGYLALDITNPNATQGSDPHGPYPALLWEFTDPDLGETWSEPVITRVRVAAPSGDGDHCGVPGDDGDCREHWVAIFGGGYTPEADPNRTSYIAAGDTGWSDESKAIFMVSLDTGAVLAKVEYDASGTNGPTQMQYAIPSSPAVLDLDFDGFADVVYVGDLGGQVWKWDISDVGTDSDVDPLIDNWQAGRFFATASTTTTSGAPVERYRSFFFPPVASFVHRNLVLAFGSGERHNLGYEGDSDAATVENNRFYVVTDSEPTGANAFATLQSESTLTDITAVDTDANLLDAGYFFTLGDGEKFVTETTVFAGYVITGSYTPQSSTNVCQTAAGQSFLHIFRLGSGRGFFEDPNEPPSEDRRTFIGGGFPTSPEVAIARDPNDDTIIIKTSEGPRVISIDAPPRTDPTGELIYWKQSL